MLENQMPMIPYQIETTPLHRFEALAVTILASYNDAAIQPRTLLSFQRAFDCDALYNVARGGGGGAPGYTIATWAGKPQEKVVIGFEGATSWAQIVELYNLNVRSSVGALQGYVWKKFADAAAPIVTALLANANFTWALNKPTVPITFAGFSLGAAVAEIVANTLRVTYPSKAMKVIKFASPRIGTVRWVAGRSRTILKDAVYMGRDPIDLFPYTLPPSAGLSTLNPAYDYTAWAASPEGMRLSLNARETPLTTLHGGSYQQAVQAARDLRRTMDRANQWSDHDKWYYYLAFLENYAQGNNNFTARAGYLEFNDRNMFGEAWVPGAGITSDMETLHTPAPADAEVQFTVNELNAMNGALQDAGADPLDAPIRDTEDGGTGGGDDEVGEARLEPVIPRVPDMRAPAPPAFQPIPSGRRRRW